MRIPSKTNGMVVRVPENQAMMGTKMELDTLTVTQRKEALERELHRIVATLIEKYKPEKIVLFGSLASGRVHEWRDIDLLVVKETNTKRVYRRAEALKGIERNVPIDLIILTPEEVRLLCGERASFIKDILEKGSVMCEKEESVV